MPQRAAVFYLMVLLIIRSNLYIYIYIYIYDTWKEYSLFILYGIVGNDRCPCLDIYNNCSAKDIHDTFRSSRYGQLIEDASEDGAQRF
jgi:hypothetical protein